jgi:hypothetical protein
VTSPEYRAPTRVIFDTMGPISVNEKKAVTSAHFNEKGTYVRRATANDGASSITADVTLVIK